MKKLLIAGTFILSAAAIHATVNDNSKALSDKLNYGTGIYNDTVPSDTTKKDSLQFGTFAYNVTDTVPSDTTKKDTSFTSALAYNRMVSDTVPTDTTKKDTMFQALAFNK